MSGLTAGAAGGPSLQGVDAGPSCCFGFSATRKVTHEAGGRRGRPEVRRVPTQDPE